MQTRLYLRLNVIGLFFASTEDRDSFWTVLGPDQKAASRFGDKSIRFNPASASGGFSFSADVDVSSKETFVPQNPVPIPVEQSVPEQKQMVPVNNTAVLATEIKRPTPVPPIAYVSAEMLTGESPAQGGQPAMPLEALAPAARQVRQDGGEPVATEVLPPARHQPPMLPQPVPIPEVSLVTHDATPLPKLPDPEPSDKRTRAWKKWKATQQA